MVMEKWTAMSDADEDKSRSAVWSKKRTQTTEYTEYGTTYRMTVSYGMEKLSGNKLSYFSITADIMRQVRYGGLVEDSGGMCHEEIAKHLPVLAPLLKWHLVDSHGVPMHYLANGRYWYHQIGRTPEHAYDPDATKAFKSTVIFGSVEGDEMPKDDDDVDLWMVKRKLYLAEAFKQTMIEFGCYHDEGAKVCSGDA